MISTPTGAADPQDASRPGLYVHVPFCARACPYCDFDFVVGRNPATTMFLDGLRREWDVRSSAWSGSSFGTLYLGGGTPSLLGAAGLERVLGWLRQAMQLDAIEECTVEVNPEHCDTELLRALMNLGVDRVSLGVQTFDAGGLAMLGRAHGPREASLAVERCRAAGLQTCVDLIVGWPGESMQTVANDVRVALELGAEHVSVYALTIEPGTPWQGLVARGRRAMPDADRQAEALELARDHLCEGGLEHYEISNFAVPGRRSLHNSKYWRWCDYLGLGPSAHSACFSPDGSVARRGNQRGIERWSAMPERADLEERLDRESAAREGLWTGLRMLEGIEVETFTTRFGVSESWVRTVVARQCGLGNLEWCEGRVRVGRGRWLWHDGISADLLVGSPTAR